MIDKFVLKLRYFDLVSPRQVLGKVPNIVLEGVNAADRSAFEQQRKAETPLLGSSASSSSVSFSQTVGRAGVVSFDRPLPASATRSPTAAEEGAAQSLPSSTADGPPAIKVDEATLEAVSRAIMGRLDVVDLIGRNTAYEAAERVSEGQDGGG